MGAKDVPEQGKMDGGRGGAWGARTRHPDVAATVVAPAKIPARDGLIGLGKGSSRVRGVRRVLWCGMRGLGGSP